MMDFAAIAIIFFMGLALVVILLMPLIMNIPIYKFLLAKMRKSMLVLMLNPSKRLEVKEAEPKSSLIVTKKGNYNFLNTPDAVYSMFGIPTAIAYHKYGAILPMQNIVHATEMREIGFKNIGEVENAMVSLRKILYGDKDTKGLIDERDKMVKELKKNNNGENEVIEPFIIDEVLEKDLKDCKHSRALLKTFKQHSAPIGNHAKIETMDNPDEWCITTKTQHSKYIIKKEEDEETGIAKLTVYPEVKENPLKDKCTTLSTQIDEVREQLNTLEQTQIEENGIIRIQDIFNFLNKNLSTDVLFSIIERSVAEEMRGMRDYFGKFQQMLPTLVFIVFVFGIVYLMITSGGGGGVGGIGESLTNIVPNIGAP